MVAASTNIGLIHLGQLWDDIPADQWESLAEHQREAIQAAQDAAQDALNACPGLSPEHSRALMDIYSRTRRDWRGANAHMDETSRRVHAARERFLSTAHEELSRG